MIGLQKMSYSTIKNITGIKKSAYLKKTSRTEPCYNTYMHMKKFLHKKIPTWIGLTVVCAGIITLVTTHSEYHYLNLRTENKLNEMNITELTQSLDNLKQTLGVLETRNDTLSTTLQKEQDKSGTLFAKVKNITNTVDTLEKLSKTDPELLQKYSKVYFLNENYKPVELKDIEPMYLFNKQASLQIHASVAPYLKKLLDRAIDSGLDLQIISGYRSFGTQALLKSQYKILYGTTKANQFSADQGYSEHQLGTTVDFTTTAIGNSFNGFEKTPEYTWLTLNAYRYGFILSYPETNTFYAYEPWHWRFVGIELATDLEKKGIHFYDTDQREINAYLATMFDE